MVGSLAEGQAQAARQAGGQEGGLWLEFEVCSLFPNHREAQRLQMSVRPSVCVKCASGLTVDLSYYACIHMLVHLSVSPLSPVDTFGY